MTDAIKGYHAHLYYNEETFNLAEDVIFQASKLFNVDVGRMHKKPVGPHPVWSCQLAFDNDEFAKVIPWLALNRKDLTVFIHPLTGDDLKDHTDYAIWMGSIEPLNLGLFQ
ncbi:DOPA 4,5-dioxygenase family protein [Endozoicomonas arenosclerae]|uniref:DOPA 4,5-dioxygenase family protein n=1 Tax=Endozoicomonas arenosclerae TaxID=1633495 RepID=UPI0007853130|nr:DOPA 4,5-dioxygenase family protein [Endozoicomonas arenosclerae]